MPKKIRTAHARDFVSLSVCGSHFRSSEISICEIFVFIAIPIFSCLGIEFYNVTESSADRWAQCDYEST